MFLNLDIADREALTKVGFIWFCFKKHLTNLEIFIH